MNSLAPIRMRGIIPQSFEDVQRIAKMAVASGLFKGDKNDDDNAKLAKASMAIMQGLEVGLAPMQAVQCIAVINGRCLIWGDAVPALLWSHGFKLSQTISGTGDGRTATCTITRPDGTEITRSFSVADAKRARLWDERTTVKKKWNDKWEDKPNDSPWFRFPDRMLGWRALGFAKSDGAADVMRGMAMREEYDDGGVIDVTPPTSSPRPAAIPSLPDIPDEAPATDDMTDVKQAISEAINVDMLEHIRENQFPDFDWERVSAEYDAKFDELKARGA